jgi:hypothetical protein
MRYNVCYYARPKAQHVRRHVARAGQRQHQHHSADHGTIIIASDSGLTKGKGCCCSSKALDSTSMSVPTAPTLSTVRDPLAECCWCCCRCSCIACCCDLTAGIAFSPPAAVPVTPETHATGEREAEEATQPVSPAAPVPWLRGSRSLHGWLCPSRLPRCPEGRGDRHVARLQVCCQAA